MVVQVAHKSREGVGNSSAAAIFSLFLFFSFFLCFSLPAHTAVVPDPSNLSFFFLSSRLVSSRLTTSASTKARKNIVTSLSSIVRPAPRPHGLATQKSQIEISKSVTTPVVNFMTSDYLGIPRVGVPDDNNPSSSSLTLPSSSVDSSCLTPSPSTTENHAYLSPITPIHKSARNSLYSFPTHTSDNSSLPPPSPIFSAYSSGSIRREN